MNTALLIGLIVLAILIVAFALFGKDLRRYLHMRKL